MPRSELIIRTSDIFGRLTVLYETVKNKHRYFACRCICGNTLEVYGGSLKSGATKSCGCNMREKRAKGLRKRQSDLEYSTNILLNAYRCSANRYGRVFDISANQFQQLIEQNCWYCGREPLRKFKRYWTTDRSQISVKLGGIDRVDNDLGYIPGNCRPCCDFCNQAKSNHSEKDFLSWVARCHTHVSSTSP